MAVADFSTTRAASSADDARVALHRVAALQRIGDHITRADTESEIFEIAAAGLTAEAGYLTAWIATVDNRTHMLQGRAVSGPGTENPQLLDAVPLTMIPELAEMLAARTPAINDDPIAQAEREGWGDVAREIGLRTTIRTVFGTDTETLGVIAVGITSAMQPEELTLLALLGSQLTTALLNRRLDAERAAQIMAFQDALRTQERLLETVRELSTPAIPIYDGILALPLVGNIDSLRANQVMETVLESIAREHASVVILDVTGVPIIDTGVANHLVQVTQAAQLLGARALLVGIKPEVAQTLVQLGVDLRMIVTRSNLQEGVAFALAQRGLRIVETRN